jgi:hypothetical protein
MRHFLHAALAAFGLSLILMTPGGAADQPP